MGERKDSSWIGAVIVASVLGILATSIALPDRIATHFDGTGAANGFMTRGPYLGLMALLAVVVPTFVLFSVRGAMRRASDRINIPNREYWLKPERREEAMHWLLAHAARLAAGISAFAFLLHLVLIRANGSVPPRLEPSVGAALLGCSVAGVLLWALLLMRHFRRP